MVVVFSLENPYEKTLYNDFEIIHIDTFLNPRLARLKK